MEIKKIETFAEFLAAAAEQKAIQGKIAALEKEMAELDVDTDEGAEAWNCKNEEALRLDIQLHAEAIAIDEFCLGEYDDSSEKPAAEA